MDQKLLQHTQWLSLNILIRMIPASLSHSRSLFSDDLSFYESLKPRPFDARVRHSGTRAEGKGAAGTPPSSHGQATSRLQVTPRAPFSQTASPARSLHRQEEGTPRPARPKSLLKNAAEGGAAHILYSINLQFPLSRPPLFPSPRIPSIQL